MAPTNDGRATSSRHAMSLIVPSCHSPERALTYLISGPRLPSSTWRRYPLVSTTDDGPQYTATAGGGPRAAAEAQRWRAQGHPRGSSRRGRSADWQSGASESEDGSFYDGALPNES